METRTDTGTRGSRRSVAMRRDLPATGSVAIVYTDVAGSTAMNQDLGDAPAHALLRAYHRSVRAALARHGGAELQLLGDGFKLAFARPRAAVACAAAIQMRVAELGQTHPEISLAVRIGISFGDPIREGGDLFGEVMIVAQRVMSRAAPGQILVTQVAADAAGAVPGVRYLDRGLFHLKGIPHGIRLIEAAWTGQAMEERVPALLSPTDFRLGGHLSVFVGRAEELRALEKALEDSEHGRGQVVLLAGPPGIGKSRLAFEFLSSIGRRPLVVAAGRCQAELASPFEPVLE